MEMFRYLVAPEGTGLVWKDVNIGNRFYNSKAAGAVKALFWVVLSLGLCAALAQLK